MPIKPFTGRVTDVYGPRIHPISGLPSFHYGQDGVGFGNLFPADGQLVSFEYSGGFGYLAIILDRFGWWHYLGHNADVGALVPVRVHQAEATRASVMGTTGNSTGVHCHWEVHMPGSTPGATIDPEYWLQMAIEAATVGPITPIPDPEEEEDMLTLSAIRRLGAGRLFHAGGPFGEWPIEDPRVTRAALQFMGGVIFALPENSKDRMEFIRLEKEAGDGLFLSKDENPDVMTDTAFARQLDVNQTRDDNWGTFVENTFELDGGATRQVRVGEDGKDLSLNYPTRQQVWRDGRPVRVTKGGKTVTQYLMISGKPYVKVEGSSTPIALKVDKTIDQVDRANAQKPTGQVWVKS